MPVKGSDSDQRAFRRRLGLLTGRARRQLSTYTQQSIGEVFGVDKETIGRWERGLGEPKAYQLHRMAVLYCAPLEPPWDLFLNPPDSLTEIDLRLAELRAIATAAAEDEAAADDDPPSSDGRGPRRGKR